MASCCWSRLAIDYGAERRRLRVIKMRGIEFRGGFHDFTIEKGGLEIYPRLVAAEHHAVSTAMLRSSGNAELDPLLGGGLERGTNALLIGAAGVGKSSLALTYGVAAADAASTRPSSPSTRGSARSKRARKRSDCSSTKRMAAGRSAFQQIDPAELSPGEFAAVVRRQRRARQRAHRRYRQPQRLSQRDARRALPHAADA